MMMEKATLAACCLSLAHVLGAYSGSLSTKGSLGRKPDLGSGRLLAIRPRQGQQ